MSNKDEEIELLKLRLQNTEKAFFALSTVLIEAQAPSVQESMDNIMSAYFEANTSLGFDSSNTEFESLC